MSATERIGIRELRQHASAYLDRVENGVVIEVTRHGRPVARLSPIRPDPDSRVAALIDAGILRSAEDPGELSDIVPVEPTGPVLASEALRQLRDEEGW